MKKKHPIRKLFIILLTVILSIFLLIGILITDFSDNTPSYVNEVKDTEVGDYLGDKAEKELSSTGPLDDFEYLFNEEELNKVLYMITRDIKIPMVKIQSIYLHIDKDDDIKAEAPVWALFYHTMARAQCSLSYDKEKVTIKVEDVRIRGFSSTKGIVKNILDEDLVNEIMTSLRKEGIEITMWKEGIYIYAQMTNIDICKTIINTTKEKGTGFLVAALVAGSLNSHSVDLIVNQNGLTGIIIHKSLL